MKIVNLENISRKFGTKTALWDISFSMEQGDFLILFGADDAGKTTLLHILMGFDRGYEGQAQVFGMNPVDWGKEERSLIRFVPDGIVQEDMTGAAYLAMASEAAERYDRKLEKKLCDKLRLPIEEPLLTMTYQENKLVQIVAAVCARPMLLVLDEPKNFLGKTGYSLLLKLLAMWNQAGMSILLATEEYSHSEGCGKHYAYLKEGELIKWDNVDAKECRKKAITFRGEPEGTKKILQGRVKGLIGKRADERIYLYEGSMNDLPQLIEEVGARDFIVEELTLEEEINRDYSRWK